MIDDADMMALKIGKRLYGYIFLLWTHFSSDFRDALRAGLESPMCWWLDLDSGSRDGSVSVDLLQEHVIDRDNNFEVVQGFKLQRQNMISINIIIRLLQSPNEVPTQVGVFPLDRHTYCRRLTEAASFADIQECPTTVYSIFILFCEDLHFPNHYDKFPVISVAHDCDVPHGSLLS
jgi:hypothetical protein